MENARNTQNAQNSSTKPSTMPLPAQAPATASSIQAPEPTSTAPISTAPISTAPISTARTSTASTTPTSTTSTSAAPASTPVFQNKSKNGLLIPLIIFIVLTLGLGIFLAVHFLTTDHSVSTTSPATPPTAAEKPTSDAGTSGDADIASVTDVIDNIATAISDIYFIKTYDYHMPLIKLGDVDTFIPLEHSYGLYRPFTNDFAAVESAVPTIISTLTSLGFTENSQIPNLAFVGDEYNYINDDIICSFSISEPFVLSCGDVHWISESSIALADELSAAYYDATDEYPLTLSALNAKTVDSSVSPYQTLTVGVSTAAGLFYRVSPDSPWQFFTATQGVLACSDYNTQDLKNAYAGAICYDEDNATDSTVQP